MALTWTTLAVGFAAVFGLPIAVLLLNRKWRNSGWWLLYGIGALVIVGNVIERAVSR